MLYEVITLDEDILLSDALERAPDAYTRDSIESMSVTSVTRKAFNLSNIRVGYTGEKKQFFDPANISANFAYNEIEKNSPTTVHDISKNFRGGLGYTYSPEVKPFEPLRNIKALSNENLALIRDFNVNYYPRQVSFRTDMNRNYNEILLRDVGSLGTMQPSVRKDWFWNRELSVGYDFSNALGFDFTSQSNAVIDEPMYRITSYNVCYTKLLRACSGASSSASSASTCSTSPISPPRPSGSLPS